MEKSVPDSLTLFVGFDLRLFLATSIYIFIRYIYSIVLKGVFLWDTLSTSSLGSNLFWVFTSFTLPSLVNSLGEPHRLDQGPVVDWHECFDWTCISWKSFCWTLRLGDWRMDNITLYACCCLHLFASEPSCPQRGRFFAKGPNTSFCEV